jgi:acetyl/propionyl-CoA carboxylase alpha subunit
MGGTMKDLEHILEEAKKQGIDLSGNTDEMVAKFAYCVSDRLLAGDTLKKAVQRCIIEISDLI